MISYLSGKIILKNDKYIVIDIGNIGYKVYLSSKNIIQIKKNEISLFCYLNTKKDIWEIYGFFSSKEMELFESLMKVSGVGPKAALEASSIGSLEKLKEGIENDNKVIIDEIFLLGKKKAEAIIFDLSRKTKIEKRKESNEDKDVIKALSKLGFSKKEIKETLLKIPEKIKVEEKIEEVLKLLGN